MAYNWLVGQLKALETDERIVGEDYEGWLAWQTETQDFVVSKKSCGSFQIPDCVPRKKCTNVITEHHYLNMLASSKMRRRLLG